VASGPIPLCLLRRHTRVTPLSYTTLFRSLQCLARSSLRTPQKSQTGVTLPVELQDNRAGLKERSKTRTVIPYRTLVLKYGKQTTTVSTTYSTPTAAYQGALICTPMRTGTITFGVLPQRLIRFPMMARLGECLMLPVDRRCVLPTYTSW